MTLPDSTGCFAARAARASLGLAAAGLIAACGAGAPEATPFRMKERIPLGVVSLAVTRAQVVTIPPTPLGSLSAVPGHKVIAVFVRLGGLDDLDGLKGLERRLFAEKFLEGRTTLSDAAGERTKDGHAMPKGLYYGSGDMGGMRSPDYVVVFQVPEESRDFTLFVENPEPQEGQPQLAAVALGL